MKQVVRALVKYLKERGTLHNNEVYITKLNNEDKYITLKNTLGWCYGEETNSNHKGKYMDFTTTDVENAIQILRQDRYIILKKRFISGGFFIYCKAPNMMCDHEWKYMIKSYND